ncbi:MAG: nickel-dependent hydrogenase large subunit [Acidimicrobiales bacterium]
MTVMDNKPIDLEVSPPSVEGDLDLRVKITDGVVTEAWTESPDVPRLRDHPGGKDPQAGLIARRLRSAASAVAVTSPPRPAALDTAWKTSPRAPRSSSATSPRRARRCSRSALVLRRCSRSTSSTRSTKAKDYDEAVRRFAPFVGESYEPGVCSAWLGRGMRDLRWAVAALELHDPRWCDVAPTLTDIRSIAILDYWRRWLEGRFLGCSIERYREIKTYEQLMEWCGGERVTAQQRPRVLHPLLARRRRRPVRPGLRQLPGDRHLLRAEPVRHAHDGVATTLIRARVCAPNGVDHEFDHLQVTEDVTHSYFQGHRIAAPVGGRDRSDPAEGKAQGKYTWARRPRYDVPGQGHVPLEVGPLARQMVAGNPERNPWQDYDPLIRDMYQKIGPSIFLRNFARLPQGQRYYEMTRRWIDRVGLRPLLHQAGRRRSGKELRLTEAAAVRCRTGS